MNIAVIAGGALYSMNQAEKEEKQRQWEMQIASKEEKRHVYSGHLLKQSKFLHSWRERYVLLSQNYLLTFKLGDKPGTHQTHPTELIPLASISEVVGIQSPEKVKEVFSFRVRGKDKHGNEIYFRFGCQSDEIRKKWIAKIKDQVDVVKGVKQKNVVAGKKK